MRDSAGMENASVLPTFKENDVRNLGVDEI